MECANMPVACHEGRGQDSVNNSFLGIPPHKSETFTLRQTPDTFGLARTGLLPPA